MTKIVHIMISAFYKEGYGYQENILSKKHAQLGYDVSIIARNVIGKAGPCEYINDRGVRVVVLEDNHSVITRMPVVRAWAPRTKGLHDQLIIEHPDIIFVHGITAVDHWNVIRYKKQHPQVKLYVDNHADYYNNANYKSLKSRIIRAIGLKRNVRTLSNLSERVWGVTPWRVQFLHDVYGISPSKTGLLVMGGDEDCLRWNERDVVRRELREQYGIPQDTFLIVTGGKIDKTKNIHLLMQAVEQLPDVWLIVFGRYEADMLEFVQNVKCDRIVNVGWIPSDKAYDYFLAADLGCFPGTHSVLWEQACASGLPCIFKDWDGGFSHVDVGGNAILLKEISPVALLDSIKTLVDNPKQLEQMKQVAAEKGRKTFAYIEIAKRAIEIDK